MCVYIYTHMCMYIKYTYVYKIYITVCAGISDLKMVIVMQLEVMAGPTQEPRWLLRSAVPGLHTHC